MATKKLSSILPSDEGIEREVLKSGQVLHIIGISFLPNVEKKWVVSRIDAIEGYFYTTSKVIQGRLEKLLLNTAVDEHNIIECVVVEKTSERGNKYITIE